MPCRGNSDRTNNSDRDRWMNAVARSLCPLCVNTKTEPKLPLRPVESGSICSPVPLVPLRFDSQDDMRFRVALVQFQRLLGVFFGLWSGYLRSHKIIDLIDVVKSKGAVGQRVRGRLVGVGCRCWGLRMVAFCGSPVGSRSLGVCR